MKRVRRLRRLRPFQSNFSDCSFDRQSSEADRKDHPVWVACIRLGWAGCWRRWRSGSARATQSTFDKPVYIPRSPGRANSIKQMKYKDQIIRLDCYNVLASVSPIWISLTWWVCLVLGSSQFFPPSLLPKNVAHFKSDPETIILLLWPRLLSLNPWHVVK